MTRIPGYWQVPGIHARPHKWETEAEYFKEHINPKQFAIEGALLRIAHRVGCAPSFAIEPPSTIRLRRLARLPDWLLTATSAERTAMARRVLDQLRRLHEAGVCHRDLKAPDIVLDGDVPLFIDFELGTQVDPASGCYDLVGPLISGVPVPEVHVAIGWRDGVWWDSPITGLSSDFGRVANVERGI